MINTEKEQRDGIQIIQSIKICGFAVLFLKNVSQNKSFAIIFSNSFN